MHPISTWKIIVQTHGEKLRSGQVKPQTPLLASNVFLQTDLPTSSFASSQDPVVEVGSLKP